jgi:hypothetical protein
MIDRIRRGTVGASTSCWSVVLLNEVERRPKLR